MKDSPGSCANTLPTSSTATGRNTTHVGKQEIRRRKIKDGTRIGDHYGNDNKTPTELNEYSTYVMHWCRCVFSEFIPRAFPILSCRLQPVRLRSQPALLGVTANIPP